MPVPGVGVCPGVQVAVPVGTVPLVPLVAVAIVAAVCVNIVPVVDTVSVWLPMLNGVTPVTESEPVCTLPVNVLLGPLLTVVPLTVIAAVGLNLLSSASE